eukprot:7586250-Lingulodinium_polyedra.AAC.1
MVSNGLQWFRGSPLRANGRCSPSVSIGVNWICWASAYAVVFHYIPSGPVAPRWFPLESTR